LHNESPIKQLVGGLVYNTGRILTYGIFGLLFGTLGKGFILAGYQQTLSILLGVLLLILVLFPQKYTSQFRLTKIIFSAVSKIKYSLGMLLKQKSVTALFSIGFLNGFLPCGLVYLGVAGAIATGDSLSGSLFMMGFGAGTLPAMLFVSLAARFVSVDFRSKIRKVVPVFVVLMATILIMRGMNLGIPYISPELSKTDCTKHSCCHRK
jgi:hypothetical protein